ncbi:MAG: methyltransferase domain-containing protein [Verrucomicrobiaceae bacterium]|nr:methyltransferase domain-containing protein [Verrucomicrobiaceae bacterium]
MSTTFSYEEYVTDKPFLDAYNDYQRRYASTIRESDRVLLKMVSDWIGQNQGSTARPRLLDIGCSTGNFLLHLKRLAGDKLAMTGGDLAVSSLDSCRANPELAGIDFQVMDITELPAEAFDIVVVNAVLYMFTDEQYQAALRGLRRALRPGGAVMVFDFAHEFAQDIEIIEKTSSHPNGLRLSFRPMEKISRSTAEAGFSKAEFQPFVLPIDLPRPADNAEIITYTVKNEQGARMAFRGTLYQPWCHMIYRA